MLSIDNEELYVYTNQNSKINKLLNECCNPFEDISGRILSCLEYVNIISYKSINKSVVKKDH